MIVIVGESASGKSSLAKYISENYNYKKIITYTTRPQRECEVDGVDYYFINLPQFNTLKKNGFFAETAEYNNWFYGSSKDDYENDSIVVLTPMGLRSIIKNGIKNVFSVYIKVPRRDRLIKCLERGDNIEEAYRRSLSDVGQFDGVESEVDMVIENNKYSISIEDISKSIIESLR